MCVEGGVSVSVAESEASPTFTQLGKERREENVQSYVCGKACR